AGFDAAVLSGEEAGRAVVEAAAVERMAAAVKALAGARAADAGLWKAAGERSGAHHLARVAGSSVGEASRPMETARRLEKLAAGAAAGRAGALSAPQVAAVADGAWADPSAEARLVEEARASSLGELREECARTKAAAGDAEERRRRIHRGRFLRTWTDAEGAWHLAGPDNPEVGAEIMSALEPIRDRLFGDARAGGRREPSVAYGADALASLCRGEVSARRRGRAKVLVRVDLGALLRGYAVNGEVCEICGFAPVAVSAVGDLLDTGDPLLAAVVTSGEAVAGVAHLRRRPNAARQSAREWLYPSCAAEGCSASTWLENDHRLDWATSGLTVLDLLDRLCSHHHDLKSLDGWSLVEGHGKRPFVPPEDPRHPRHAHAPPEAAA
ncbi:MAG TPA: hypothetical protein VHA34_15410, partial [Actinomycetes bacterium]|nr:hypothetical protein [Actinomycetes bacterium]